MKDIEKSAQHPNVTKDDLEDLGRWHYKRETHRGY